MEDCLRFETQAAWAAWLRKQHAKSPGVWLELGKKGSEVKAVSYAEALDAALCYGWIDGQKKPGPPGTFLQRFTRRGEHSIWSKINREKALALIAAGRMQPAGLVAIEHAKDNGQWEAAYDGPRNANVPEDLESELRRHPQARAFFEKLNRQNRYAILFRLQTAKRPETRARRLQQFVDMLNRHETIHPQ